MQDRFKFRVWHKKHKKLYSWDDLLKTKEDNSFYWCMLQAQNDEKNNILMQCTGLKDKNGKLIYEGDIINIFCKNFTKNQISEVKFCKERAAFTFDYVTDMGNIVPCTLEKIEIEIIGNVYQHEYLLKEYNL